MSLSVDYPWYPAQLRLGVGTDKRGNEITVHCWTFHDGIRCTYHRHSDDVYVGPKEIHHFYAAFQPALPTTDQENRLIRAWMERVVQTAQDASQNQPPKSQVAISQPKKPAAGTTSSTTTTIARERWPVPSAKQTPKPRTTREPTLVSTSTISTVQTLPSNQAPAVNDTHTKQYSATTIKSIETMAKELASMPSPAGSPQPAAKRLKRAFASIVDMGSDSDEEESEGGCRKEARTGL